MDGDTLDFEKSLTSNLGDIEWIDDEHFKFIPKENMNGETDLKFKLRHNGQEINHNIRLKIKKIADKIKLKESIMDIAVSKEQDILYQIPNTVFEDTDGDAEYTAKLVDGSELPEWLIFDAENLQFRVFLNY